MKMEKNKKNQGFSLIEIMFSIAILALITIPLLSYFTMSVKQNARSRQYHGATVAAQTIMEDVKSKTIEEIWNTPEYQKLDTNGTVILPKPAYIQQPGRNKNIMEFLAEGQNSGIKNDKEQYDVVITLSQEGQYREENQKKIPILTGVTGDRAVSIYQEGQDEDGALYFYNKHLDSYSAEMNKKPEDRDPGLPANPMELLEVKEKIKKLITVKVEEDPLDASKAVVNCTYEYTPMEEESIWGVSLADTYMATARTDAASVEKPQAGDSMNIFLFYRPLPGRFSWYAGCRDWRENCTGADRTQLKWGLSEDGVTLDFYMVSQEDSTGALVPFSDYRSSAYFPDALAVTLNYSVYSNVDLVEGGRKTDWVKQEEMNRLFEFSIQVYPHGAARIEENRIAAFDSSKGEWNDGQ